MTVDLRVTIILNCSHFAPTIGQLAFLLIAFVRCLLCFFLLFCSLFISLIFKFLSLWHRLRCLCCHLLYVSIWHISIQSRLFAFYVNILYVSKHWYSEEASILSQWPNLKLHVEQGLSFQQKIDMSSSNKCCGSARQVIGSCEGEHRFEEKHWPALPIWLP